MRSITPILKKTAVIILIAIICLLVLPGVNPVTALPDGIPSSKADLLADPTAYDRIPFGATLDRLAGDAFGNAPGDAPSDSPWPTTKSVDEEGYTVWTVDYGADAWCVPVSTLRYPIDLGEQDTTELYDVSLRLRYDQDNFYIGMDEYNNLIYIVRDPTWSVGFNSHPYDTWQIVGSITGSQPFVGDHWENSPSIPIDRNLLNDGENNVWLKQHDLCPETLLDGVACTCITLNSVKITGRCHPAGQKCLSRQWRPQCLVRSDPRFRDPGRVQYGDLGNHGQREHL